MMQAKVTFLTIGVFTIAGCSSSRHFELIPKGLDFTSVQRDTITIRAKHFEFNPEIIRIKPGTLVHLTIMSTDGTHGFKLSDFGIDERLDENVPREFDIYFLEKGEYSFRCSHLCGIGHFGMNGKIIVE